MDKINEIPGDALERILSKFDACVEELLRKPETLLRQFCDENDAYTFEEDYCAKNGRIDHCTGISFSKELSYMDVLSAITAYLEQNEADEDAMDELLNPEVEELEDRMIICFPFIKRMEK